MSVVREIIKKKRGEIGGEALPDFAPGFLTTLVDRRDKMPDKERIHTDYIHVSAMIDWCPRKYALQGQQQGKIPSYVSRPVTGAHRIVWALGRAAEKHVRESLITAVDFKGVFGVWKCVCEKTEHAGFYNEAKTCQFCKGKLHHYHEYTLFDDEHHVCGNPDLMLVRRKRVHPVEIKSLTNSTSANATGKGFDTLKAPFGDHVFQVDAYHYMIERAFDESFGLLPGDRNVVFYVNKEFKWGSPYKEFWLKSVEPQRKANVRREFSKAKGVYDAIHGKAPLPERKLCPSCKCDRAKKCPVVQECFAKPSVPSKL